MRESEEKFHAIATSVITSLQVLNFLPPFLQDTLTLQRAGTNGTTKYQGAALCSSLLQGRTCMAELMHS